MGTTIKTFAEAPDKSPAKSASLDVVQRKSPLRGLSFDDQQAALAPVQREGGGARQSPEGVRAAAAEGVRGSGGALPHLDRISAAFGGHDVSGVSAHVGGTARAASREIGASAYAMGESVAFGETPGLHTAAHEAAHVVQQRQGVSVAGGVGKAGDGYERQADAVADRVVAGKSATDLLGPASSSSAATAGEVQRALPNAAQYRELEGEDAMFGQIADAVASYNEVAGEATPEGFQARFIRLQAVERLTYRFLANVSDAHQLIRGHNRSAMVKDLLAEAEREHEVLVDAAKDIETVLPFDPGALAGQDLADARALWRDIVSSHGNIKVSGSAGYTRRVLSELAKIMSTGTGLRLLKFLNAPKTGEDGAPIAISQIFIGETLAALPEDVRAASPDVEESDKSKAQVLGIGLDQDKTEVHEARETPITGDHDRPSVETHPVVGPGAGMGAHFDAVVGGKRGFVHGNAKYDFAPGTGSFVTSNPGEALNGNAAGNEIHTPGWVTLGHELGHSANMKAGATTISHKAGLSDLANGLAGGEQESEKWDNSEEQLVIENVENKMRDESGQALRSGHRAPAWVLAAATQLKTEVRAPLYQLATDDPSWAADPEWNDLRTRIQNIPAKTCATNPGVMDPLRAEVAAFVQHKRDALLPQYLNNISKDGGKGQTLFDSLDEAERTSAFLFLHRNVAKFATIRQHLHIGFGQRLGMRHDARRDQRVQTLRDIVAGNIAI